MIQRRIKSLLTNAPLYTVPKAPEPRTPPFRSSSSLMRRSLDMLGSASVGLTDSTGKSPVIPRRISVVCFRICQEKRKSSIVEGTCKTNHKSLKTCDKHITTPPNVDNSHILQITNIPNTVRDSAFSSVLVCVTTQNTYPLSSVADAADKYDDANE